MESRRNWQCNMGVRVDLTVDGGGNVGWFVLRSVAQSGCGRRQAAMDRLVLKQGIIEDDNGSARSAQGRP